MDVSREPDLIFSSRHYFLYFSFFFFPLFLFVFFPFLFFKKFFLFSSSFFSFMFLSFPSLSNPLQKLHQYLDSAPLHVPPFLCRLKLLEVEVWQ